MIVCFATYILFAYTEIVTDMEQLVMIGWFSISICGAVVLINLTFMTVITYFQFKLRGKRWYNHRQAKAVFFSKLDKERRKHHEAIAREEKRKLQILSMIA